MVKNAMPKMIVSKSIYTRDSRHTGLCPSDGIAVLRST
jgi:hypothetical protein